MRNGRYHLTSTSGKALGTAIILLTTQLPALADSASQATPLPTTPTASPLPSPTPSQAPVKTGLTITHSLSTTFIDRQTNGPGTLSSDAAAYLNGSPIAPNTPYDLFSGSPLFPGATFAADLRSTFRYTGTKGDIGITTGVGYVTGSGNNAFYWGENPIPAINPQMGSGAIPTGLNFPQGAGGDSVSASAAQILSADAGTKDGNLRVTGGYFDVSQADRFAFVQPGLTAIAPSIAIAPPESLSSALAGSDLWSPTDTQIHLRGLDLVAKHGIATMELANGSIPTAAGDHAQTSVGALVLDHGEGTRYSLDYSHTAIGGNPYTVGTGSGSNPQFTSSVVGTLPSSTLSGQEESIAGARATFHAIPKEHVDGVAEVGRSWYSASTSSSSNNQAGTEGDFTHLGLNKKTGRATAALDYFRMNARYADIIVPHPVAANVWSAAAIWPTNWLGGSSQMVDNTAIGPNRQAVRVRYALDGGPFEIHTEYTNARQLEAATVASEQQVGFVEPFFTPQQSGSGTQGNMQRYALWAAWHPKIGDFTLDMVQDNLYRGSTSGNPADIVALHVPQVVATYVHHINQNMEYSVGSGLFSVHGTYATSIGTTQHVYFGGVVLNQSSRQALLINLRHTETAGSPITPVANARTTFSENSITVEQRWKF